MPHGTNYAADFRKRAEELRSIAGAVREIKNRETILRCAADYERMAERYKARIAAESRVRPRFASRCHLASSDCEVRAADCRDMAARAKNDTDAKAWRIIARRWDSLATI